MHKFKESVIMDFNELITMQNKFDKEHGWLSNPENFSDLIDQLHRDLVGLLGELGEFANILKKITLIYDRPDLEKSQKLFEELKGDLSEELIDSLIYFIRITVHLNIDVEKEYANKLSSNRIKYKDYGR